MKKLFRRKENDRGSVTIEATIALTAFLFAFLMIYSIITVCRAQARIQIAINSTAKEISQYSYLYGLSGLDETLKKFQADGQDQKDAVNSLAGNVVGVFDSIQTIGKEANQASEKVNVGDTGTLMSSWDKISDEAGKATANAKEVGAQIETMASDPKKLLLGMAKLAGSEGLEIAKSRAIAEPVSRALIKKHLIRNADDTAEAFCRSVGIVPGTYFGKESYFNGLDFSNSTLFPYGSDEISIIVTYKVKLLELLPVNVEYTITQTAITKGWLHGDGTVNGKTAVEKIENLKKEGETIWSKSTVNQRNSTIVSAKLDELKSDGYNGVSGETYIQAYDTAQNKVVMIGSANPLYGLDSVDKIDRAAVKEDIKRRVAQIESSTRNRVYIEIKKKDSNGNYVTEKINCSNNLKKEIILVVPEDEGLKQYIEGVISEMGYSGLFKVEAGYGSYLTSDDGGGSQ